MSCKANLHSTSAPGRAQPLPLEIYSGSIVCDALPLVNSRSTLAQYETLNMSGIINTLPNSHAKSVSALRMSVPSAFGGSWSARQQTMHRSQPCALSTLLPQLPPSMAEANREG